MRLIFSVMLAVFVYWPGISSAQDSVISDKVFSIGPRLTFSQPKDADSGSLSDGMQLRFDLLQNLKVEGSVDYRRNDFSGYTKVQVYPLMLSALAYFTPKAKVSPFLLGGAGLYFTQVESPFNFSYTTTRLGLHAGLGLEIMLNDTLSLDGIYRHIWVEKFTSRGIDAMNKEYDDSGYTVTMGINILF
ncbi:MAG: hypothetical protein A2297_00055 [Elusimicrobia bacterium RIFOXYB2_FULL_48_7]|nr:MAG: hypothetical protein A2297_00055 [Elusimicrobia bacterium RIFOXYB2_FULL_48_7]